MLHEVDEAALGEVVGAVAEQAERAARRRVGEAAEGGAVEREVAAVILEDRAGRGLRHPGAEFDLAERGGCAKGAHDHRAPRCGCGLAERVWCGSCSAS